MNLGSNEQIVLSLFKKYGALDQKELDILFFVAENKKARIDGILRSLKIKGILNEKTGMPRFSVIQNTVKLPEVKIKKEIIKNLHELKKPFKLGELAKSILYVISKTEKCSLQFLTVFFKEPSKNISAILKRLEEKNLVVSYNSRIRHTNSVGRKYHPKYFVLSEFGTIWCELFQDNVADAKKIDELLKKPQDEIKALISNF